MQRKISKFLSFCIASTILFSLSVNAAAISETIGKADQSKNFSDYSDLKLIPLGQTSGIKLFADGIMVVELSAIATEKGEHSAAATAGIQTGDVITHVNGIKIKSTEHFQSLINASNGKTVNLLIKRDDKTLEVNLIPDKAQHDGKYRIGAWVRDSMAGIGTITYIDPKTGMFGALGHGICDIDTGKLMPFSSGSMVPSSIKYVKKGESGTPGELHGEFDLRKEIGIFYSNTEKGIFGRITEPSIYSSLKTVPVAKSDEVKIGNATIISNISGKTCASYEIQIVKIYNDGISFNNDKNMMIVVTDQRLLDSTGGIVQGMSGSPILQNGKLIGAVTHVLVNDPKKGYAIFIENMLQNMKSEKMPKAA